MEGAEHASVFILKEIQGPEDIICLQVSSRGADVRALVFHLHIAIAQRSPGFAFDQRSGREQGLQREENKIMKLLLTFHKDETGQGLVEYVLIIALIAFGAVTAMSTLATDLNSAFTAIGSKITSALA